MPFHGILSNTGQFSLLNHMDAHFVTCSLSSNLTTPSLSKVAKEPGIKGK